MDGPNHERLFHEMKCLNGTVNLDIIVRYLRFYKGSDMYQNYLRHYFPMLPDEVAKEFAKDLDTPSKKIIKDKGSPVEEKPVEAPKKEDKEEEALKEEIKEEEEKPKKKKKSKKATS